MSKPPKTSDQNRSATINPDQRDESTKCKDERDFVIPREHVDAGSPPNYSVCGEEDPGIGLEFVVRREE